MYVYMCVGVGYEESEVESFLLMEETLSKRVVVSGKKWW